ncbi:MAG: DUF5685 family protein [Corallococcus sp.]|nr:DUF5685 family protein [Corallococcus sp.]
MFGYVNIAKDKLEEGQQGLYQTFMCGLCMSTKRLFGQSPRATVNYDITFFNVLFHSFLNIDVDLLSERCIAHPFKKRSILKQTSLCDRLAAANILLVYLNLYDDVVDGGKFKKKAALKSLKKTYLKATDLEPVLNGKLQNRYEQLRNLEKEGCGALDKVCHPFANLSKDFAEVMLGNECNGYIFDLCYNIGKWIYLIDALDDVAQDIKSGQYNAIVSCFSLTNERDVTNHLDEISFVMYATLNRIAQCYNDLNLTKYTCILSNVIYESLRDKTKQVLGKY